MQLNLLIRRFSTASALCKAERKFDRDSASTFWARSLAGEKTRRVDPVGDEQFPVLIIPGHTKFPETKRALGRRKRIVPPPRYLSMRTNQDWTNVWPTAQTFRWSSVPFPVRQGVVEGEENDGIPPGKYANAELMKIPNFLHLTPSHVTKHCAALKQFCTPWPKGLESQEDIDRHFPVTVTTSDILADGPSPRDARTRTVTLKVKLAALKLDEHASDKLLRLVGDRYDNATDTLTIITNRCPTRKQNYDYAMYLLTVLCLEANKTEAWEAEKTADDLEKFVWEKFPSRGRLLDSIKRLKDAHSKQPTADAKFPQYLDKLTSVEQAESLPEVAQYKAALAQLHNEGESVASLTRYKDSVKKLLLASRA